MSFRLEGEVKDWELFYGYIKAGEKNGGKVFYRENQNGAITEAVYFSGAKMVAYTGEITAEKAKIIRAQGYKVKEVSYNAEQGILKIIQ
ncbi:MAG: hypothetical protein NWF09_05235 [Candidatus Bathyarchaeota archaeon]|nr:hypothetical protein [Candidatus Bathyarchaeota archaeon]